MEQDFVVFIHVVDPTSGKILSQVDAQPQQGARPTSGWIEGEVIADTHSLTLPGVARSQAATFSLRIGLYIPLTGET